MMFKELIKQEGDAAHVEGIANHTGALDKGLCQGKLWTESYRNISSRKAHELFTFHEGRRPELPVISPYKVTSFVLIDLELVCIGLPTDELPQSLLSASPLVALDGVLLGSARVKVGRGRQPS